LEKTEAYPCSPASRRPIDRSPRGVGDPVEFGLVANLARPSGNLTGFSNINVELTPKRLELLPELVPQAKVIALFVNRTIRIPRPSYETCRNRPARMACSSLS
jgi:ABC-type uncharacterized transport system substrate-binding protein